MAAAPTSKKELTTLLEGIRTENYAGKFVDDDFCRRNFAHLAFENEKHFDDILKGLTQQGQLLHFVFGDRHWYLVNDRYTVEEVLRKQVEDETNHVHEQISQTREDGERRRLLLKQSVIKQIAASLEQRFAELARMDEALAEKILSVNTRVRDQLLLTIGESTKKFKTTLNQKDVTTTESLKRMRTSFGDLSFSQVMEILEALEYQGRIIIVPLADRQRFFLDYQMVDTPFIQSLERDRNTARAAAEAKTHGVPDHQHKHLAEYNRYMMLDNTHKLVMSRQQTDQARAFKKVSTDRAQHESAQTTAREAAPPGANPAAPGVAPGGGIPGAVPRGPGIGSGDALLDGADQDALKAVFTDRLPDEELDTELGRFVEYEASKKMLGATLDGFRTAKSDEDRRIHFRTFFACVALRIRIPGDESHRLYDLAREYLNRMGGRMSPELREEAENKLIEADRRMRLSESESAEFERFPLAKP